MNTKPEATNVIPTSDRRKAFRVALAVADMRQQDFAEQEGVTPLHLSLVLNGKRDSQRLNERIDAFIAEHYPASAA